MTPTPDAPEHIATPPSRTRQPHPGITPSVRTTWRGLIGFYTSCATVSLGACVGALGFLVFGSVTMRVAGIAMVVAGIAGAFVSLSRARR